MLRTIFIIISSELIRNICLQSPVQIFWMKNLTGWHGANDFSIEKFVIYWIDIHLFNLWSYQSVLHADMKKKIVTSFQHIIAHCNHHHHHHSLLLVFYYYCIRSLVTWLFHVAAQEEVYESGSEAFENLIKIFEKFYYALVILGNRWNIP